MNTVIHISSKFFSGNKAAFARWAGVNPSNIWRWETSGHIPAAAQFRILEKSDAENFGITPDDFFPSRKKAES